VHHEFGIKMHCFVELEEINVLCYVLFRARLFFGRTPYATPEFFVLGLARYFLAELSCVLGTAGRLFRTRPVFMQYAYKTVQLLTV